MGVECATKDSTENVEACTVFRRILLRSMYNELSLSIERNIIKGKSNLLKKCAYARITVDHILSQGGFQWSRVDVFDFGSSSDSGRWNVLDNHVNKTWNRCDREVFVNTRQRIARRQTSKINTAERSEVSAADEA